MEESTLMKDLLNDVDYLESTVTNSEAPVNDYTQNVSQTFNLTADLNLIKNKWIHCLKILKGNQYLF